MRLVLDIFTVACAAVLATYALSHILRRLRLRKRSARVKALASSLAYMSDELIAHAIEALGCEVLNASALLELEAFALELMSVRPVEGASLISVITEIRIYRSTLSGFEGNRNEAPRKGAPEPSPEEPLDRSEKLFRAAQERAKRSERHVKGELRHNPLNGRQNV